MKKILTFFACVLVLFGCSNKSSDSVQIFQVKVEIKDALDAYAADYTQRTGTEVRVETLGGGGDYGGTLKAKSQADQMPDIFTFGGIGEYLLWKDYISDLSDEPWVKDTDLAFTQDGKVYGFPVSIEGIGLAYNVDILQKAGIDPATLITRQGYVAAFEKINAMKDELGLNAVVAIGTSIGGGMWWDAAQHNFATYFSGGLPYEDVSLIEKALNGELDEEQFYQYAQFLQLLFKNADQNILQYGSYDDQIASFAQGKTAFLHQGNWVDPNLTQLGIDFEIRYAPLAFLDRPMTGLHVFAPSFYAVNKKSPRAEQAKEFLRAMASTPEGHEYMVKKAGMIPAFKSVTLVPEGQLSRAIMQANAQAEKYGFRFSMLPEGSILNFIAPVYDLFGQNSDNIDQFTSDMKNAISNMAKNK
ncbi:MAG: ABC transporter substrate-binding protein [Treponemataceae bacterium]